MATEAMADATPLAAAGSSSAPLPATLDKKPKITLIWLEKSRAQRIVWLLEELNLEYDVKAYKRTSSYLAPTDLKQYHPLGKSPVLLVDDLVIAESANITEYLIDHFGPHLKPSVVDSREWLDYRYFMHYAEGTLMPFMVMLLIANQIRNAPGVPFFLKWFPAKIADALMSSFILPNVTANFEFLEKELEKKEYLCGSEMTGADIMMSFPFEAMNGRNPKGGPFTREKCPKIFAYVDNYQKRPAYIKADEKVKEIEAKL